MNVLILGASGLVGGNCMTYFRQAGLTTVGTHLSFPTTDTHFYDTLKPESPLNFDVSAFQPDWIVHCGALTHVDYCEEHIAESHRLTVESTYRAADMARSLGARLVYLSTDYVFDGLDGPYSENALANPLSVYGHHKLEAEDVALKVPGSLLVRVTNVYGDEIRGKNFVARILSKAKTGEVIHLKLPYDQYATPTNAADIARALSLLIQGDYSGTYHLAGTDFMNRCQLAARIAQHLAQTPGLQYHIEPVATEALGQAAKRPLLGGLKAAKFLAAFPNFVFSNLDDYLGHAVRSFTKEYVR